MGQLSIGMHRVLYRYLIPAGIIAFFVMLYSIWHSYFAESRFERLYNRILTVDARKVKLAFRVTAIGERMKVIIVPVKYFDSQTLADWKAWAKQECIKENYKLIEIDEFILGEQAKHAEIVVAVQGSAVHPDKTVGELHVTALYSPTIPGGGTSNSVFAQIEAELSEAEHQKHIRPSPKSATAEIVFTLLTIISVGVYFAIVK